MERKTVNLRFKDLGSAEGGEIAGWLSTYNNVDQGGDLIEPGAFADSLRQYGNEVPLLWQHQPETPIGMLSLEDRASGLWATGKLLMNLPEAQRAYVCAKAGIVKGLSIGFDTIKDSIQNGVRYLKQLRLYEGSIVTFPMNESAVITAVKGDRAQLRIPSPQELATARMRVSHAKIEAQVDGLIRCCRGGR